MNCCARVIRSRGTNFDVGEQDDLLVRQFIRNLCQVGLSGRHKKVFGLCAVHRIAEGASPNGFIAVAVTALREVPGEAGPAPAARGDGADQHTISHLVPRYTRPKFVDDADRFMADHQARPHRILPAHDMEGGGHRSRSRSRGSRPPQFRRRAALHGCHSWREPGRFHGHEWRTPKRIGFSERGQLRSSCGERAGTICAVLRGRASRMRRG